MPSVSLSQIRPWHGIGATEGKKAITFCLKKKYCCNKVNNQPLLQNRSAMLFASQLPHLFHLIFLLTLPYFVFVYISFSQPLTFVSRTPWGGGTFGSVRWTCLSALLWCLRGGFVGRGKEIFLFETCHRCMQMYTNSLSLSIILFFLLCINRVWLIYSIFSFFLKHNQIDYGLP